MIKEIIVSVLIGLNGYAAMIEDIPEGDEYSAIVCHVDGIVQDQGNTYTSCTNYQDDEDTVWLDGSVDGNTLKVTFEHDSVHQIDRIK